LGVSVTCSLVPSLLSSALSLSTKAACLLRLYLGLGLV
jgi:hypothetical protein